MTVELVIFPFESRSSFSFRVDECNIAVPIKIPNGTEKDQWMLPARLKSVLGFSEKLSVLLTDQSKATLQVTEKSIADEDLKSSLSSDVSEPESATIAK